MTLTSEKIATALAGLPESPVAFARLLADGDRPRPERAVLASVAADVDVAALFLRLAHNALPGRTFSDAQEAAPLLGESITTRLALLAAGGTWLRAIVGEDPLAPPLLRHSIATAVAAEPLGRESGSMDPLHAFLLGLLHHLGDAARLSLRRLGRADLEPLERWEAGGELFQRAGAPPALVAGLVEYGRFMHDPCHEMPLEAQVLAAADHAVSTFGYAAPSPCALPAVNARIMDLVARLHRSKRRICRSIEDVMSVVVEPVRRLTGPVLQVRPHQARMSPVVLPEVLDGVSTRDLGPLPVLFARISGAHDPESIMVAAAAGLVEELGVARAYFLQLLDGGSLKGGVLCARGNVPLPLNELVLERTRLPRPVVMALATGRPILHECLTGGLDELASETRSPTFFVPVLSGKRTLGILGVEVVDPNVILPDLLAAIAAHTGLALTAADLQRLSNEAKTDELTGLYNRRGILDVLDRHLESLAPTDQLAIALIDCDHLKKVNDNFGHLMGDEFVRRISEVVKRSLRASDELGRYGGDEFLAVLPDANLDHTARAMERSRANVEQAGLESADGLLLSISIGAVVRGQSGATREKLLKLADFALYRAKEVGRNSVKLIDADAPPDLAL